MSKVKTKWRLNCIKREMGCVQRHFIRAPAEDFVKLTVNSRLCFIKMPWTTDWISVRISVGCAYFNWNQYVKRKNVNVFNQNQINIKAKHYSKSEIKFYNWTRKFDAIHLRHLFSTHYITWSISIGIFF